MIEFKISSLEQIENGVARARSEARNGREFMPSGAMFAGWCKPSLSCLGVDPFELAYRKTIDRAWEQLHPAFQVIAQETYEVRELVCRDTKLEKNERGELVRRNPQAIKKDVYKTAKRNRFDISAMRKASERDSIKLFKPFYDEVVSRVSGGEMFKRIEVIESIRPFKAEGPTSRERADAERAKCMGLMGLKVKQ